MRPLLPLLAAATLLPAPILAAPLPATPEQTVRQLTAALLRGDRKVVNSLTEGDDQAAAALADLEPAPDRALRLAALLPGADLDTVILDSPDQPEPSGHLLALAMAMPLVRLQPPEAATIPDSRVVMAGDDPDRQLLLR